MGVSRYKAYSTLRVRQVVSIQSNDFLIQLTAFLAVFFIIKFDNFCVNLPTKGGAVVNLNYVASRPLARAGV
ncbi:hypothetical protein CIW69_01440 [Enterobacter cloacae]|nr:hypothetical protein CIW69_01440 [Enterobacter cloacae]